MLKDVKFNKFNKIVQELFRLFAEVFGLCNNYQEKLTLKTKIDDVLSWSKEDHALVEICFAVEKKFNIQLTDKEIEKLTNSNAMIENWFFIILKKAKN